MSLYKQVSKFSDGGRSITKQFLSALTYPVWRKRKPESSSSPARKKNRAAGEDEKGFVRLLTVASLVATMQLTSMTAAATDPAPDAKISFNIPRQRADLALVKFAEQADVTYIFPFEAARQQLANPLVGSYAREEAIGILLRGTGLLPEFKSEGVMTVQMEPGRSTKGKREMPNKPEKKRGILAGLIAALSVSGTSAVAQEDQSKPSMIEEIIVTAQKREQSLQDVALSVSALSGKNIDRRGLVEMSDYLNTIPGVTMIDRGTSRRNIAIRGLAVDPTFEAGSQSTVGVYFGDVPLNSLNVGPSGDRGGSADLRLVDMERVEVLRGPQGTLFGASSLAGTVRNIPRSPELNEYQARLATELSFTDRAGDENTMFQGMINIPLQQDALAFRGVAYHFSEAGYIDNIGRDDPALLAIATTFGVPEQAGRDEDIGTVNVLGMRASLLWVPTDRFNAQFIVAGERQRQEGLIEVQTGLPGNYQQSRLDISSFQSGALFAPGGRGNEDTLSLMNLVLQYDLGPVLLHSSTSYGKLEATAAWNGQGTLGPPFSTIPLPWQQDFEHDGVMQEFRISSQLDGPLRFTAGVYYEDTDRDFDQVIYYGGSEAAYAAFLEPALGPNPFFPKFFGDTHESSFTQKALFGEVSYEFLDDFELTLGARRFDYDARQLILGHDAFIGVPPVLLPELRSEDTGNNFKANVSYTPNEDMLFYAQWAEGFRQAAPTRPIRASLLPICDSDNDGLIDTTPIPVSAVGTLTSDTSDNYELGTKLSGLFAGRLQVNAALFQIHWSGLPNTIRPPCGEFFQLNTGKARSRGIEVETAILLSDNLLLNLNGSYINAELTEDVPVLSASKGDPLPGSADVNFSAGLQYDSEINGYPAYVGTDVNYVGDFYNNLQETGTKTGDYWVGNIRAGVTFNKLTFEIFAKNFTDSDALTWLEVPIVSSDQRGSRLRPRTIGISFRYDL